MIEAEGTHVVLLSLCRFGPLVDERIIKMEKHDRIQLFGMFGYAM
jgi:hypothetical protein